VVATPVIGAADRPVHATGVTLRRRSDDGVALLEGGGRYVQLSDAAVTIWHWCDGLHDVDAIVGCYRERYAIDANEAIIALLERWHDRGLIARCAVVAGPTAPAASAIPGCDVVRSGMSVYLAWRVDAWDPALQWLAQRAFAAPALATFAASAVSGCVTALRAAPHVRVHGAPEYVALGIAFAIAVIVHEAGHALTLVHFGGRVRRAGIGWYWCAPIAFVDTSDAHALPRAQRIGVSLAGPAASFVVAGLAALIAVCVPDENVRAVAWSLAIGNYAICLWNLNPLIELDGYYALADVLDRPNLRSDAFRALRQRCPSRIELAYAGAALTYALVFGAFAISAIIARLATAVHLSVLLGR
jgi:Zn-dependent protease